MNTIHFSLPQIQIALRLEILAQSNVYLNMISWGISLTFATLENAVGWTASSGGCSSVDSVAANAIAWQSGDELIMHRHLAV